MLTRLIHNPPSFSSIVAGVAVIVFVAQPFRRKVAAYFALLPFLTYLQIHAGGSKWSVVASALLVATAFHACLITASGDETRPIPAYGATALVMTYAAIAIAEAFNPNLPSVTIGLRGLRLVAEPLLLYFIGAEVARRPDLLRLLLRVLLVTGVIVVVYAIRQGLNGFDTKEAAFYKANFSVSAKESRIFGTMAGASVLGHYVALVAFLAVARVVAGVRRPWAWIGLVAACAYAALLTGQRGVYLAALVGGVVVVIVACARAATRPAGLRAVGGLAVLLVVFFGLLASTPVSDRANAASKPDNAFQAARTKLALLKKGTHETSADLRFQRLHELERALEKAPEGAGTGLNLLLLTPKRQANAAFLGKTGFGKPDYRSKVDPIPGELYYFTLGSELGLAGLVLFLALGAVGVVSAVRTAVEDLDRDRAVFATAAAAFLVFVLVDSLSVDAMTSIQVSAYFWLFIGVVTRSSRLVPVPA